MKAVLHKVSDVVLECEAGKEFWPKEMFEPLTLAFCFPFISHRPWQLRQSPAILGVGRMLQRLWKVEEGDQRIILQKFCQSAWNLESLSSDMVWKVLQGPSNYFLSSCSSRKRRRSCVDKKERSRKVPRS